MEEWVRKSMKNIIASISFEFIWLMMSIFHFVLVKANFFFLDFCIRMSFHDFYISYSQDSGNIYFTCIYIRCLTLSTTVTVKMLSIFKNLLLIRNSRNIQIRCFLHNLYDISNFYTPAIILLLMLMSLSTALML